MSFWRTYYHIVWVTKNREALITPQIEPRLYGYIVNKAAELGVYVYALNGWTDHVHVVAAIPPKEAVAHVVKTLKGSSSHDLNQQYAPNALFAWQRGTECYRWGVDSWLMRWNTCAGRKNTIATVR